MLKEKNLRQVYSFDVQKYIYFQQFQNHCLFFTVEIFKWNNKTKNSICTYTVYIDMTHAFVFQCLVQVLQLSAPFNHWNKKAGSLEILLILIYVVANQISIGHILSVSHREKSEQHPTNINRYKTQPFLPYIQYIIF